MIKSRREMNLSLH